MFFSVLFLVVALVAWSCFQSITPPYYTVFKPGCSASHVPLLSQRQHEIFPMVAPLMAQDNLMMVQENEGLFFASEFSSNTNRDSSKRQKTMGDVFDDHGENSIQLTNQDPVSTFSVDVDTASYSYVRRQLQSGSLPLSSAVKIEEFINYFEYSYPQPLDRQVPFEPSIMVSSSPWNEGRKLMHIGIQGFNMEPKSLPFCNLVFLVDVSGSMESSDKLPLAKTAMEKLLQTRQPGDLISIVTYASNVKVVLPPTPVARKELILSALRSLQAGGGTWGQGGLELAYEMAQQNFDPDAVNRILLLTDGDFNLGAYDAPSLQKLVEKKRDTGIFLSVLGFGMGNYKDTTMKALANHGNGVAAYIDSVEEAHKVMVKEASSSIFPIAKDAKVQVEFNPATVAEYRLVGYEKRRLRNEDFNNDKVDAGDVGSGHTVTAIYEFTPTDSAEGRAVDPLRYQKDTAKEATSALQEYAYLKIRYKLPKESESKLLSRPISKDDEEDVLLGKNSSFRTPLTVQEFKFATAVAGFAQLLKKSRYVQNVTYQSILDTAIKSLSNDPNDYRKQFIELVTTARALSKLE